MVTGRRPLETDTSTAVLVKHAMDPLPRPRDRVADLPAEAEQVQPRDVGQTLSPARAGRTLLVTLGVGVIGCAGVVLDRWLLTQATRLIPVVAAAVVATDTPPQPAFAATLIRSPSPTVEIPTTSPTVFALPVAPQDAMPQVQIPAGPFLRGSHNESISLDEYWIDQTEFTNAMCTRCVAAGICPPPGGVSSETRAGFCLIHTGAWVGRCVPIDRWAYMSGPNRNFRDDLAGNDQTLRRCQRSTSTEHFSRGLRSSRRRPGGRAALDCGSAARQIT